MKSLIPNSWKEIFITLLAFSSYFFLGACEGYAAFLIAQINNDVDFKGTVGNDEKSWLGSLSLFAMPIGCIVGGLIMDSFGRKWFVISVYLPHTVCWLIMANTTNIYTMYLARVIGGIACGMSADMPTYISEICTPTRRGPMLALGEPAFVFGIMICNVVTWKIGWRMSALVMFGMCILVWIPSFLLPESPSWLTSRGRPEEAKKVLRGLRDSQQEVQNEMNELEAYYNKRKNEQDDKNRTIRQTLSDLWSCWRQISIAIAMCVLSCCVGTSFLIAYTVMFFENLQLPFDAQTTAIIHSMVLSVGSFFPLLSSIYFRRRTTLLISGCGMTVFIGTVSVYESFFIGKDVKPYVELVLPLFYAFDLFYCVGALSLPYTMVGELLPAHVAGVGIGTHGLINYLLSGIVLKVFPYCLVNAGMVTILWFMTACALTFVPFSIFILPETKGKTIVEVQEQYFSKK